jgi:ribosomal-protein-alanine N-acetyltransferase
MENTALEFRRLGPDLLLGLRAFFESLAADPASALFHPHPFTDGEAERVCTFAGKDLYLAAAVNGEVRAYGMLRGWDEGYAIPSLGIAVHPSARGTGLGAAFMQYLHAAAAARGAKTIRLKVYAHNAKAKALYERLGYVPAGETEGQLLYTLALGK